MARTSRVELVQAIASFLWILGNWWWMIGENWIHRYHEGREEGYPFEMHRVQSTCLLVGAFSISALYYFVQIPCKILMGREKAGSVSLSELQIEQQTDPSFVPDYHELLPVRFPSVFVYWRDWANCQILFWSGKDLFWLLEWETAWAVCALATLGHTLDMIRVTWMHSVENLHYWAQLVWVIANMIWAFGDLFEPFKSHSDPESMFQAPSDWQNLRWWASWAILPSFLPILWLYILWVPATIYGDAGKRPETRKEPSKVSSASAWD
eukprot:CAMPEP_0198205060 /NCGR_PEP_ID=MMETSP1445-20131203/8539_1 /TAXON_ID=36898 /ORGANISM="Pyramimonas sp., Strain CCMP2087" /LENGTH=265 /DNA_ID=CAMNT_0043877207 /DNA_START=695 /DNA_END=1492 /DNA_ORIENTATION=-